MSNPPIPTPKSALLLTIERFFMTQQDEKDQHLALDVVLDWEQRSDVFRTSIDRIDWWEHFVERTNPVTYERLKRSMGRRANITCSFAAKPRWHSFWRNAH